MSKGDSRNSADRRRQRAWLLSPESGFGGDGETVPCYWCDYRVADFDIDRFPVCGHDGGRYVKGNIVPAHAACNRRRCSKNRRCSV